MRCKCPKCKTVFTMKNPVCQMGGLKGGLAKSPTKGFGTASVQRKALRTRRLNRMKNGG